MTDKERVNKGLKAHLHLDANCIDCPYIGKRECLESLMNDTLKALEEQPSEIIERLEADMVVHDLEQCGLRHCCSGCSRDNTHADARCIHELLTAAEIAIRQTLKCDE